MNAKAHTVRCENGVIMTSSNKIQKIIKVYLKSILLNWKI